MNFKMRPASLAATGSWGLAKLGNNETYILEVSNKISTITLQNLVNYDEDKTQKFGGHFVFVVVISIKSHQ